MKTLDSPGEAPPGKAVAREEPLAGNYFVAAYPPFSQWEEPQVAAMQDALDRAAPARAPLGIYAHIPFCQKKCVHYQNEVTLRDYEAPVERGELPLKRARALSDRDRLVREFILGLKLGRVEGAPMRAKFGVAIEDVFAPVLSELEGRGMLELRGGDVVLSREGLLCVDRLLPEFYDPKFQSLRYT